MKVSIYLPEKVSQSIKGVVQAKMIDTFGGLTSYYGTGYWKDETTGDRIVEHVTVCESYTDMVGCRTPIAMIAAYVIEHSQEKSIMYTVGNNAFFKERT